jgi:hypothetical protein
VTDKVFYYNFIEEQNEERKPNRLNDFALGSRELKNPEKIKIHITLLLILKPGKCSVYL